MSGCPLRAKRFHTLVSEQRAVRLPRVSEVRLESGAAFTAQALGGLAAQLSVFGLRLGRREETGGAPVSAEEPVGGWGRCVNWPNLST